VNYLTCNQNTGIIKL